MWRCNIWQIVLLSHCNSDCTLANTQYVPLLLTAQTLLSRNNCALPFLRQGKEVEDADSFSYNSDFSNKLYRIKFNSIQVITISKDKIKQPQFFFLFTELLNMQRALSNWCDTHWLRNICYAVPFSIFYFLFSIFSLQWAWFFFSYLFLLLHFCFILSYLVSSYPTPFNYFTLLHISLFCFILLHFISFVCSCARPKRKFKKHTKRFFETDSIRWWNVWNAHEWYEMRWYDMRWDKMR